MSSTPPSPKPKRRTMTRRWFQDLGSELKNKLKVTSRSPSRSSQVSGSHVGSRPASPHSSRASSHRSARSGAGRKRTAWGGLKITLNELYANADLVPPLKSAIGELVSLLGVFEAAAKNRQDYEKLAIDLEITTEFLNQHLKASIAGQVMDRMISTAQILVKEVESIKERQKQSTTEAVLGARGDEEDLIRHYRRIEQLLHRIQIEASMSTWAVANEHLADTRLEKLEPAKLASFDSKLSTSIDRRTCTKNTRKTILSDLKSWSDNPDGEKVYWMDGMAGTGKTTIACTLASELESRGQLAASFFCTRTLPECRDANRIVPTIAYQFARRSTAFQSVLCQALSNDPDIGSKNISTQFERLLKEPLERVKEKTANNMIVVVDALDECEDTQVVSQILEILFQNVVDLPVKFFVTSRPEAAIRDKMISEENISRSILHLHDIERSLVREDIELYLQKELEFMSPAPSDVKQLATLSDNLFIYAATAVRYIRPVRRSVDPHERMARLLAVDSQPGKRFSHIDSLYSTILTAAFDDEDLELRERERIQLVLWSVVCAREPIPLETITALSGISDESHALLALQPLRSVIYVSEQTNVVSTLHASFSDYIFTQDRSERFFCNKGAYSQLLTRRCLEVMEEQLRFNICGLPSSFVPDRDVPDLEARMEKSIPPRLSYVCRYWPDHLKIAVTSDELRAIVEEFLSQRLLFWMEVLNLKGHMVIGVQGLVKTQEWLRTFSGSDPVNLKLASDAHKFVARFASHAISLSTPHIYLSALPLCPPSSLVSVHYRQRLRGLIQVKGTAIVRMGQAALTAWTAESEIESVAYSPDGAQVAYGTEEGLICIRNAHDGKLVVGPFEGHTDAVTSIMFSPKGDRIVSGSQDGTIRVWNAREGTPVSPFDVDVGSVTSVAFSPDGTRIVSSSDGQDLNIQLWNSHDGTAVQSFQFEGYNSSVNSVAYSPDGTRIISGADDFTIRVWDAFTGELVLSPLEGHTKRVSSVAFSPDGKHIISGSGDNTIRVWDAHKGTLSIGPLEGHTDSISSVAHSSDGAFIASGSRDATIRVWKACDGTLAAGPFEGHTGGVKCVAFSPDQAHVISTSEDQSVRIWNISDGQSMSSATPLIANEISHPVSSLDYSPNGKLIACGLSDGTILVLSALDGSFVISPFEGRGAPVFSLGFSPDSSRIVSCPPICVWDVHDRTPVVDSFEGHEALITSVAFSPDGARIVSGSRDSTIRVWGATDGTLLDGPFQGYSNKLNPVALSPDGTHIAASSNDGTIHILKSFSGDPIGDPLEGHTGPVTSIRFSSDGSRMVSSSIDETIRIWDPRERKPIAGPLKGHTDMITSVALSPNGALVASCSEDRTIRIWHTLEETLAAPPIQDHVGIVCAVGFSPDGLSIVSGSVDRTVRVWYIQGESGIHEALSDVWGVREDGWILNSESQMLLCVPAELRHYFPKPSNRFTIGPLGSVQVDYKGMLLGEEWSKCWITAYN
ncbi:Vegetative incompatibility protein HET-E-1 [Ceratobasidium theobromae]|uniref:Vegetative incompatibility protein HET-E-1 n=1 Tax=Ceratobasidium theobromae TaxID=1582974 RepID=A0A5N5QI66_9AGAM|nr:Vegetative incompatibility protein HET-E-1 [Ceratobasidium theobromae]